jgi:hypothetical protein
VKNDALETATSGVAFVSDAAQQQATALIRGKLHVDDADRAVGPDGRPAADYIRGELGRPEYAHFLKADTRNTKGGTIGTMGASHEPSLPAGTAPVQPRTIGEALILRAVETRQSQQQQQSNPATDLSLPFGLRPRR